MASIDASAGWKTYAITGRPDFLNYLRRGDVGWTDLWRFYQEHPTEPDAILRLSGLFHIFLSQEYEREGSVLDRDGDLYARLKEWAVFAVAVEGRLAEDRLRDSLANLLGQSLISPLYYEAVFTVYLETTLERQARLWSANPARLEELCAAAPRNPRGGKLTLRLQELPSCPVPQAEPYWEKSVYAFVGRSYAGWNEAFALAIGEEHEAWIDEGGSG